MRRKITISEAGKQIIQKKTLEKQVSFSPSSPGPSISLESPIEDHAKWVFNSFYQHPYSKSYRREEIPRPIHGIQHVSRVAAYIPVLANLYRRHGDTQATALNDEDLKLLQIAALFHDSAREAEGPDLWDEDSAIFLYAYLVETLEVSPEKAKLIAEAVANKDTGAPENKIHRTLNTDTFTFEDTKPNSPRNIYQKLIHDADSLDIRRIRAHYIGEYLDFYQDIAKNNADAFENMAQLIHEVQSLIEVQGDSFQRRNITIKKLYEHEQGYRETVNTILPDKKSSQPKENYIVLPKMFGGGKLLPTDSLNTPLTGNIEEKESKSTTAAENWIKNALKNTIVLARGIRHPSAKHIKKKHGIESLAAVELRKVSRRKGVKTRTAKPDNLSKHGNRFRSASLLNGKGPIFANAGFLIINPAMKSIHGISPTSILSGTHKKNNLLESDLTDEQKQIKFDEIIKLQKLGGASTTIGAEGTAVNYPEILLHVTDYQAIYFSQDPTNINKSDSYTSSPYPIHPHSAPLQALFLKYEYQKKEYAAASDMKEIPIFEYSAIHGNIQEHSFSPEKIITMWTEICRDYIEKSLEKDEISVLSIPIDQLKTLAVYGRTTSSSRESLMSPDSNYPLEIKELINQNIESEITKYRDKAILKISAVLESKDEESLISHLLSPNDMFNELQKMFFQLFETPSLYEDPRIKNNLTNFLKNNIQKIAAITNPSLLIDKVNHFFVLAKNLHCLREEKIIHTAVKNHINLLASNILMTPGNINTINLLQITDMINQFNLNLNEDSPLFLSQLIHKKNSIIENNEKIKNSDDLFKEIKNYLHLATLTGESPPLQRATILNFLNNAAFKLVDNRFRPDSNTDLYNFFMHLEYNKLLAEKNFFEIIFTELCKIAEQSTGNMNVFKIFYKAIQKNIRPEFQEICDPIIQKHEEILASRLLANVDKEPPTIPTAIDYITNTSKLELTKRKNSVIVFLNRIAPVSEDEFFKNLAVINKAAEQRFIFLQPDVFAVLVKKFNYLDNGIFNETKFENYIDRIKKTLSSAHLTQEHFHIFDNLKILLEPGTVLEEKKQDYTAASFTDPQKSPTHSFTDPQKSPPQAAFFRATVPSRPPTELENKIIALMKQAQIITLPKEQEMLLSLIGIISRLATDPRLTATARDMTHVLLFLYSESKENKSSRIEKLIAHCSPGKLRNGSIYNLVKTADQENKSSLLMSLDDIVTKAKQNKNTKSI